MNLKKLESRFKDIEHREKQINSYFNPFTSNGPKHYCIKDLYRDYEYDTKLYGFGKFFQLPSDQPSEIHQSPAKKSSFNFSSAGQDTHPKVNQMTAKPSSVQKEDYHGAFSSTRLQPRNTSLSSNQHIRSTPEWSGSVANERVTNKSALEKVRFNQPSEALPINLFKKQVKEKVQVDPKEWVAETQYSSKPMKKFSLGEEKVKKSEEKLEFKSKWFDIRYCLTPCWTASEKGFSSFMLVSSNECPRVRVKTVKGQVFNLNEIDWLKNWKNKIIRVQEEFSNYSEYFLFFGERFEGSDKFIEDEIELFFRVNVPRNRKKSSVSPVMPINLKSGKFTSPGRSKSSIKLPVIKEKTEDRQIQDDHTLTQRLVKYRESFHKFNPVTFPANLTIFEMHDLMETRYRKRVKVKHLQDPEPVILGIDGKSMKS
jgi:hypothetical protein